MIRIAKFSAPLFAVALLLGLTALTQANDNKPARAEVTQAGITNAALFDTDVANAAVTLEGVTLGEHVMGPKLGVDDLKNRVVVFEFWGDRCPPCHASIPSIVQMRSEYTSDKLAIVANQVWTKDAEATKNAWTKHGGDDSVTVINHGSLENTNHRGVPHVYVLDHKGELIWNGNPHPRAGGPEMKEVVKKAVAALPSQS